MNSKFVYFLIFTCVLQMSGFEAFSQFSYKIVWTDLTNVTDSNGVLTSTSPGTRSGANATNVLPAGQDGWTEFLVDGSMSNYIIGFASNRTGMSYGDIANGLFVANTGLLYTMESGSNLAMGSAIEGDVLRVSREGSTIKYYRNGVELRSVATDAQNALFVKSSISQGSSPITHSSFDVQLMPVPVFTYTNANDSAGALQITVSNGSSPYTYQWSSGESTSSIAGKRAGIYSVTITDSFGRILTRTYGIGNKIIWTDLTNASDNNGVLTSSTPGTWSSANSANVLTFGQDGWAEFVVDGLASNYIIGFTSNRASMGYPDIANGLLVANTGLLYTMESGSPLAMGTALKGDVLRVSREGSMIKYYRNGVELRSVATDAQKTLFVRSSISQGSSPIVRCSFDFQLTLLPMFTDTNISDAAGAIQISVSNGSSPYTYQWFSGENTASITGKNTGIYSVTVTDFFGRTLTLPYGIGHKIIWTDLTNVTDNNGVLTSTFAQGTPGSWSSANSTNVLGSGHDGWVEFIVGDGLTNQYVIGFTSNMAGVGYQDITNGIYVTNGGAFYTIEGGNYLVMGTALKGDVLRVSREGSMIKYYRNGVELRSVATNAQNALFVKSSIYQGSSPAARSSFDVQLFLLPTFTYTNTGAVQIAASNGSSPYAYQWSSGESTSSITGKNTGIYSVTVTDSFGHTLTRPYGIGPQIIWTDLTNATDNNGVLTSTSTQGAWSSSANSIDTLKSGQDGWAEFVVDGSASHYIIGFASDRAGVGYQDITNGLYVTNLGTFYTIESGNYLAMGTALKSDVLRVSREGAIIKYYRNGVELRSVATDAQKTLFVKSSIYQGSSPDARSSFSNNPVEGGAGSSGLCQNIYCIDDGGVGIDTPIVPDGFTLAVKGKIISEGVKVMLQSKWPDYVFEKDYKLASLNEVDNYIQKNGHLPNMPSAEAVKKEGVDLGSMDAMLLQKLEEVTLYLIQIKKENELMKEKNESIAKENELIKKEINTLKSKIKYE